MTLRKILIFPALISLLLLVIYSPAIYKSYEILLGSTVAKRGLWVAIVLAATIQLLGHVIRSYKMRFLLSPVKQSTVRFQFRALSIGYLGNVLLPLRLGELLRAKVMASGDRISFGLALLLIIIERIFDGIILLGLCLLFLLMHATGPVVLKYALALLLVIGVAIAGLIIINRQNQPALSLWYRFTRLFNPFVRDNLRFKAWSVIYGLQRIISRRRLGFYASMSVAAWGCYIASALIVVKYLLPSLGLLHSIVGAVSPYFGMSAPAGPASLGAFSKIANDISGMLPIHGDERIIMNIVLWAILVGPISVAGMILLAWKTKEPIRRRLPMGASSVALSEKLSRNENISTEMGNFLDNYFSGNSLSKIVHRLELRKDFRLLKYFKGGSDAITILALQNGETVVKKIIPKDVAPRLKAQYDWLKRRRGKHDMVKVLREQEEADFYAIDLAYSKDDEMYFEYMHHSTLDESKAVLDAVWDRLHKSLYSRTKIVTDHDAVQQYIDKHIFGCMAKACAVNSELLEASKPKYIQINGKKYLNLEDIMKKIMSSKAAMKDLATFSRSEEVHGDVAVDNILVSKKTKRPLIIDPAPDGNIITGPVFDFGKNLQSLYCGYEFIIHSNDVISLQENDSIEYHNRRSQRFKELCDYVIDDLSAKYLSEGERRAMIFHAGALLMRRLKHQVYQAPRLTLAIYAAGIRALNDFYGLYENTEAK